MVAHDNFDPNDLEDIPGTTIFTMARAREGYQLHRFCMSLMKSDNRDAFRANEDSYLRRFAMTGEQRRAILSRDYNRMIALGGNIYFLVKIASTDGWSVQRAVSTMTGMSVDDYSAMMLAGGRPPTGNLSIKGGC